MCRLAAISLLRRAIETLIARSGVTMATMSALMLSLLFAAAGMAHAQTPAQSPVQAAASINPRLGCDAAKPAVPPPDLSEPDNIDFFKKRLLYYRCTAYDHDIADVLDAAQKWVAVRAPQVPHPAIVLDIDETSLLNSAADLSGRLRVFLQFPGWRLQFRGCRRPLRRSRLAAERRRGGDRADLETLQIGALH